jgi:hypothetical protein
MPQAAVTLQAQTSFAEQTVSSRAWLEGRFRAWFLSEAYQRLCANHQPFDFAREQCMTASPHRHADC